jgi:uncharacterized glyoxalase superfamily protein PhnB
MNSIRKGNSGIYFDVSHSSQLNCCWPLKGEPLHNDGMNTVIPNLRYPDAPAAIEWLCDNFGFTKHAVYANPDGTIGHAELTLDGGMIMLSSRTDTPFSRFMQQPAGGETQSPYVIVPDADAVYAKAKGAGAEILIDLKSESYGGRGFTCRDPQGHIWSIGTYNPWSAS